MIAAAAAVAVAFVLDQVVGEPPDRLHPVAWLGALVARLDREWVAPGVAGLLVALLVPLLVAALVWDLVGLAVAVHPAAGAVLAGLVLFVTTSLRLLTDTADAVARETETDLDAARGMLRALAGRDADALSAAQVRSAAAESVAENLADGLVAPLLAFAVLASVSLPLAAGGAAWVKAVNTLDSMLGYPSKPAGRASARLDDLVMWVPARLSAALIAVAAVDPDALLNARKWAGAPPSPNSGWPMATLAGALGVRLEKPGVYELNPIGTLPTVADVSKGVRVVRRAGVLAYLLAGVVAWS
ncbi:adenosylcobinamide-phosphate synthase CbiB [Halobacteriaceae archaeon GCM10025711]